MNNRHVLVLLGVPRVLGIDALWLLELLLDYRKGGSIEPMFSLVKKVRVLKLQEPSEPSLSDTRKSSCHWSAQDSAAERRVSTASDHEDGLDTDQHFTAIGAKGSLRTDPRLAFVVGLKSILLNVYSVCSPSRLAFINGR